MRRRDIALSIHATSGLFALALCGGAPGVIAALALPVVLSAPWVRPPLSGVALLVLLASVCAPVMWWLGTDDAVLAALIALLVHQRTAPEADREDDWVALLTALMLVASSVRVDQPAYAVAWLGWTVSLPVVLGDDDGRAPWRSALPTSALLVALAALAFLFLPRPSDDRPFPGIGEEVEVGHFIDADHRHEEVAKAVSRVYSGPLWLRATSFVDFDGQVWRRRPDAPTPAEADIPAVADADFVIRQEAQGGIVLLPGPLTAFMTGPPHLRETDGTRWTGETGRIVLTARASPEAPWPTDGPPGPDAIAVPDDLRPVLDDILTRLNAHEQTPAALDRITSWVHDAHAYEAGGVESADLPSFLRGEKRGDCSHFATSMVLLARAAGMPARLITGYVQDAAEGDAWVFRRGDAHAWAEVYLPGSGWSRVDATAALRDGRDPRSVEPLLAQAPLAPRGRPPRPPLWTRAWAWVRDFDAVSQSTLLRVAAPVALLGALAAAIRWLRRRQAHRPARPATPARSGVAAELDRALVALERHGLRPSPSTPAVETARALGDSDVARALEELAWLHYEVAFGGGDEASRLPRAQALAVQIVQTPRRG